MNNILKATTAFAIGTAAIVAVAPGTEASMMFSDVSEKHIFATEIYELSGRNIISGYEDGTFKPGNNVTRAQAAKILAGVLQLDTKNVKGPGFTDVDENSPYYGAIAALKEANIISGYGDDTFHPNAEMTRGQMAKVLVNGFKLHKAEKAAPFIDIEGPYKEMISTLYSLDITTGKTATTFEPAAFVTRGQLVAFVVRAERTLQSEVPGKNTDTEQVVPFDTITISDVTDTAVITNVGELAVDKSLQPLFTKNKAALQGAELKVTIKNNEIVAIHELILHSAGTEEAPVVFDGNKLTVETNVMVDADYVTLQNVTIKGDVTVTAAIKNAFSTDNVTVDGNFYVQKDNDNNVASLNVRDVFADMAKQVKFNLKGFKTNLIEVARNNVAIQADQKQPKLHLIGDVSKIDLQLPIAELVIKVEGKVELIGASKIDEAKIEQAIEVFLNISEKIGNLDVVDAHASLELGKAVKILNAKLPEGKTSRDIFKNFEVIQQQIEHVEGTEIKVPEVVTNSPSYTPSPQLALQTPIYLSKIKENLYFDSKASEVTGGTIDLTYTGIINIASNAKLIMNGTNADGTVAKIEISGLDVPGYDHVYTVKLTKNNAQALARLDLSKPMTFELEGVNSRYEGYKTEKVGVSAESILYDKVEDALPADLVTLNRVTQRMNLDENGQIVSGVLAFTYFGHISVAQNAVFTIKGKTVAGEDVEIVVPNLDTAGYNDLYEVELSKEVAEKLALLDRQQSYTLALADVYTSQPDRVQQQVQVVATQLEDYVAPTSVSLQSVKRSIQVDESNNIVGGKVELEFDGIATTWQQPKVSIKNEIGDLLMNVTGMFGQKENNPHTLVFELEASQAQQLASLPIDEKLIFELKDITAYNVGYMPQPILTNPLLMQEEGQSVVTTADSVTLTNIYTDVANSRVILKYSGDVSIEKNAQLVVTGSVDDTTPDTVIISNLDVSGSNNSYAIDLDPATVQKLAKMQNLNLVLTGVNTNQPGTKEQAVTIVAQQIEQYVGASSVSLTNVKKALTVDENNKVLGGTLQLTFTGDVEIAEDAAILITTTDKLGNEKVVTVPGLDTAGMNNVYTVTLTKEVAQDLATLDDTLPMKFALSGVTNVAPNEKPTPAIVTATKIEYDKPVALTVIQHVSDETTSQDTIELTFDGAIELKDGYSFSIEGSIAASTDEKIILLLENFVKSETKENTYTVVLTEEQHTQLAALDMSKDILFSLNQVVDATSKQEISITAENIKQLN